MSQEIKNVIVIGAGGNLGPSVLQALDSDPQFTVSVLSRKNSTSTFPAHIKVHEIDESYPENELLEAFKNQDAVILTLGFVSFETNKKIIDASIKAGVKRLMPTEYGSDTANPQLVELIPVYQDKVNVTEYLKSQEAKGLTWTALVTGPFIDWGLKVGFIGFDLASQKATIYDSGTTTFAGTTLADIGLAVAGTLHNPEQTANKKLFIASLSTTQKEVLASLEKATGKKWDVQHTTVKEALAVGQEKMGKGDFAGGLPPLILAGLYGAEYEADHTKTRELANDLLGLKMENLDDIVAEVVKG